MIKINRVFNKYSNFILLTLSTSSILGVVFLFFIFSSSDFARKLDVKFIGNIDRYWNHRKKVADLAFTQRDFSKAEVLYQRLYSQLPAISLRNRYGYMRYDVSEYLARTYVSLNENDKAVEEYKNLYKLRPYRSDVLFELSNLYYSLEKNDKACKYFIELKAIDPFYRMNLDSNSNLNLNSDLPCDHNINPLSSNKDSFYLFPIDIKAIVEDDETLVSRITPIMDSLNHAYLINIDRNLFQLYGKKDASKLKFAKGIKIDSNIKFINFYIKGEVTIINSKGEIIYTKQHVDISGQKFPITINFEEKIPILDEYQIIIPIKAEQQ